MRRLCIASLAAFAILPAMAALVLPLRAKQPERNAIPARSTPSIELHPTRQSATDLEIGGELAGLRPGTTRFVTREALLTLPQVTYTVTDDSNFTGPTKVSGVELDELKRSLGAAPKLQMIVAICDDKYRANYPREYVAAHRPLLVLAINDRPPAGWPKDSEGHGYDMGPYLISHPKFTPSFKIFSHSDEPQIPWGVVRLELRDERAVFAPISPRGTQAGKPLIQAGYRIAQQNCFRCHNMGTEGARNPVIRGWCWPRGPLPLRITLTRMCAIHGGKILTRRCRAILPTTK